MGVDDHHVFRSHEDGAVAVDHGLGPGLGKVHAVGGLLQIKELVVRRRRCGTRPCRAMPGQLHNGGARQSPSHEQAQKVAPRGGVVVRMRMLVRVARVAMRVVVGGVAVEVVAHLILHVFLGGERIPRPA